MLVHGRRPAAATATATAGSIIACNLNGITGNSHARGPPPYPSPVPFTVDNRRYPAAAGPPSAFLSSRESAIRSATPRCEGWDKAEGNIHVHRVHIHIYRGCSAVGDRESPPPPPPIIGDGERKAIIRQNVAEVTFRY